MEVQAPLFLSKMEPIPEEVTEKRQDMAEKKNSLFLHSLGNSRNFIRYYRKRIIVVLVFSAFIIACNEGSSGSGVYGGMGQGV